MSIELGELKIVPIAWVVGFTALFMLVSFRKILLNKWRNHRNCHHIERARVSGRGVTVTLLDLEICVGRIVLLRQRLERGQWRWHKFVILSAGKRREISLSDVMWVKIKDDVDSSGEVDNIHHVDFQKRG